MGNLVVITVANQKGGVGKTTTAVTLAHGLARQNYNVLLVDLDPQGQCASLLGLAQEPGVFNYLVSNSRLRDVVRSTEREGLWVLPGNKRTETAQVVLTAEGRRKDILTQLFASPVVDSVRLHYVVMDTAPAVGVLQANALYAADPLILPAALDFLALEGVAEVLNTLDALQRPSPPVVRVLPTFYDEVTRESKSNLARLHEAFPNAVLGPIHRATILRECAALGRTIFEHAPESRAAQEYGAVVAGVTDE
ncbi:MAG: ParA family protein [Chloroflexi bacterium]|nr:ParA family protein [Chloroflexota bacterium]